MEPGLSIVGLAPETSNTVDSNPTRQSPPSKMISNSFWNSFITSSALVGLILPDLFALGAAIGRPVSFISSLAMG